MYTLTYTYYVKGTVYYTSNKQKSFVGVHVVQMLSEMHRCGFVHGDVRLDNIVFSDDRSHLIDFDFVGWNIKTRYHDYNSKLCERHQMAVGGNKMKFEHDRFSLAKIIDISCVASSVAKSITTKSYVICHVTLEKLQNNWIN